MDKPFIDISASFTGRGRNRHVFIYSKLPDEKAIKDALNRAFHMRWSDSFPLLQDRCTAVNSAAKIRRGDSATKLMRYGMSFPCEILSPLRTNLELGAQLRKAILSGKLNGLCFIIR